MALLVTHECPECKYKGYLPQAPCSKCGYGTRDNWTDTLLSNKDIESTAVYQEMVTQAHFRSTYVPPKVRLTTRIFDSISSHFKKPIDCLQQFFDASAPHEPEVQSVEMRIMQTVEMFMRMALCTDRTEPDRLLQQVLASPVKLSAENAARLPGIYPPSEYDLSHLNYCNGYVCVTNRTQTGFEPYMEITIESRVIYRLADNEFTYLDETETRSNNPGDRPQDY